MSKRANILHNFYNFLCGYINIVLKKIKYQAARWSSSPVMELWISRTKISSKSSDGKVTIYVFFYGDFSAFVWMKTDSYADFVVIWSSSRVSSLFQWWWWDFPRNLNSSNFILIFLLFVDLTMMNLWQLRQRKSLIESLKIYGGKCIYWLVSIQPSTFSSQLLCFFD